MTARKGFRPHLPKFAPVAVVDIGSNSVRLVVYDALRRAASPVFNEKILCGLGRGVAATGRLSDAGVARALPALARFSALCKQIGVVECFAIATAAAREAKNGKEFIAKANEALNEPVTVLTGKQEARYAALGVLSSIPGADGIAGDLGGGSLELVDIKDGKIRNGVTLPLGPFRLMDAVETQKRPAREIIDEALAASGMMDALKGRSFYAVGGAWRNLARFQMKQSGHPLSVLQQYTLGTPAARSVAILVAGMTPDEIRNTPELSKKRADTLPLASEVLDRLLVLGEAKDVVFSVYGVREGVLYNQLKPSKRAQDPLLAGCWDFARRYARSPDHERELCDWTDKLFSAAIFDESSQERRLRHAACLMADIGWRAYPGYRGPRSLTLISQSTIVGIDHPSRVFLALTIFFRYEGPGEANAPKELAGLITPHMLVRARQISIVLRLAYALSAAMPGLLPKIGLEITGGKTLTLTIPKKYRNLNGEVIEKRLSQLATILDVKGEVVIA